MLVLDPYIIKAMGRVTGERLSEAIVSLYPDYVWDEYPDDDPGTPYIWIREGLSDELAKWLNRARKKLGTALSTGRTNSFRGCATCALLKVLGVDRPKAPRTRFDLAWAILDSPEGREILGHIEALETARETRGSRGRGPERG